MPFTLHGLTLPVTLRPAIALSDEALIRLSEENKTCKIERTKEGEITIMTPGGGIGGGHEVFVASTLFLWSETDGRGVAFGSNTGFNLDDGSCLSPDAAWLSLARWNALTPKQKIGFPPLCPEFLIEIRSQSDPRRLLETKMQLWLENGAQLAWLIDPLEATITIYRPGEAIETLARPATITASHPVAGFSLRTERLWSV